VVSGIARNTAESLPPHATGDDLDAPARAGSQPKWRIELVSEEPAITISSRDFKRLDQLLDSLPPNSYAGADLLRAELERAQVLDPKQMSPKS